jgi:hypothetical protein
MRIARSLGTWERVRVMIACGMPATSIVDSDSILELA